MTVYLVGAGPTDPGLITVRGADAPARAVVVYDRLASVALLDLVPPNAELISAAKAPGQVELTQHEINALLVERGHAGATVVRHRCVGRKLDKTSPPRRGNQLCESGKAIYLGWSDSPISDGEPCRKAPCSLNATTARQAPRVAFLLGGPAVSGDVLDRVRSTDHLVDGVRQDPTP